MTKHITSPPPAVPRIDFLEGLRGFLAVYVMFAHVGYFVGLSVCDPSDVPYPGLIPKALSYLDLTGWDAVNVFMILSGFVIFHLLRQGKESYPAYILRRFFRLWPIFILCITAGMFMNGWYADILTQNIWSRNYWIRSQAEIATTIQANLTPYYLWSLPMLHGVVPQALLPQAGSAFSSLAWCISTEWQFYLAAGFFFWLLQKRVGAAMLGAFVVFSLVFEHIFDFSVNPNHSLLPLQLHWFYLGMISYLAYRAATDHGFTSVTQRKLAGVVGLALALAVWKVRFAPSIAAWLVVLAVLVARPNALTRPITAFFNNSLMRYCGRLSYPIYLVHWPVSILLIKTLMKMWPESSWTAAYVVLILTVPLVTWPLAHLAHVWLESPAMNLGRQLAARWTNPGK